jgi:DNA repair exonuclease SbcCD ATPase subunit
MIKFKVVRWKNFLSTGNSFTYIDLHLHDTTLILGENGSGKSTMLDALTFGLFGRPFRKINKPQLVNSINNSDCLVEVEFDIGTRSFLIRRGIKPNIFEIFIDGVLLNQDARAKDYQEVLEKTMLKLNHKSFTQIIMLGSSSFQPFMQLPVASRREVIEDLLDIQIFSVMNQLLKERAVENDSELHSNSGDLELNSEKIKVQEKYIKEVKEINSDKIEKTKKDIEQNNRRIEENNESIQKKTTEVDIHAKHLSVNESLQKKKVKLVSLKNQIESNLHKTNKNIEFFEHTLECPTCQQGIDSTHKDSILKERSSKIAEYDDALIKIYSDVDSLDEKLSNSDELLDEQLLRKGELQKLIHSNYGIEEYVNKLQEEIEYLYKVRDKSSGDDERLQELKNIHLELNELRTYLVDQKKYIDVSLDLLKDTGIKTLIIKKYLPVMNGLVNKYLSAMESYFNFTLDEQFNEVIKSRFRDVFSYDSFSEGEKMRIDLALLFTWRSIAKMKNSANTNLLILDEVFDSSLDSVGTEEFLKLLSGMDIDTNIFVISHKGDTLYDKFNSILTFEKKGNFSKVV